MIKYNDIEYYEYNEIKDYVLNEIYKEYQSNNSTKVNTQSFDKPQFIGYWLKMNGWTRHRLTYQNTRKYFYKKPQGLKTKF